MRSEANTPEEYLAELPEDRREALTKIRKIILENLPEGYEEAMNWGMITYQVPLSVKPDTYNSQPLMFAALASQKNHMAVYLTGIYASDTLQNWFMEEYKKTGKRMDIGKSCVRFKKLEDLPLELVGESIRRVPMDMLVEYYEKVRE